MFTLLVEITCTVLYRGIASNIIYPTSPHNNDKNQPVKRDSKVYPYIYVYTGRSFTFFFSLCIHLFMEAITCILCVVSYGKVILKG